MSQPEPIPEVPEEFRGGRAQFAPAPDLAEWIQETFISEGGPLYHPTHQHLQVARLAVLWTSQEYTRKGKRVLGKAETGAPPGVYGWSRGRLDQQTARWFSDWFNGMDPDFLVTLYGPYVHRARAEGAPRKILGLVEHELCHCAQATDEAGAPKFHQMTGRPKFTIRAHDAELFAHVIGRYGAHTEGAEKIRRAFQVAPQVEETRIQGVCGCGAPVAA